MTTITPEEALKSKKNFEEFMADYYPPIVTSTLASYPKADGQTVVSICDSFYFSNFKFKVLLIFFYQY